MTTPSVNEVTARLEPVEPDPFIETLPLDLRAHRLERELHERRIERVRRLIRIAADRGARNGRPAGGTDRA